MLRTHLPAIAAVLVLPCVAHADDVGYADLKARLGAATPTGSLVSVGQVEALESPGKWGPDRANAEFAGKTFTDMSGTAGISGHATFVGQNLYGAVTSIAPGITRIWVYEAGGFCQRGNLNFGFALLPGSPPGGTSPVRVFNHSWIGSFGDPVYDKEVLRRADYSMDRDGTLFVVGENNGAGSVAQPLMSSAYNGLAVGLMSGNHSAGDTLATADGAGRMKPEIVAPGQYTSFATPVVTGAAALLYDTALTPPNNVNPSRAKGVTIKSALMCGASHAAAWQNQAPSSGANRGITVKPLDPVYGAGTVNVNRAHRIVSANESGGSSTPAAAVSAGPVPLISWDYELAGQGHQRHYRIDVPSACDASVLVTWNRAPGTAWTSTTDPSILNLRVELQKVVGGVAVPISGDAGIGVFSGGNVVSDSAVDNVEHLYVRGLSAGTYVISVTRTDALATSAACAVSWYFDAVPLLGDLDNNGHVDGSDLGALLGAWGMSGPGDLNSDGVVNGGDLGLLLGAWR